MSLRQYRAGINVGPFDSEVVLRKLLGASGASVLARNNTVYGGHLGCRLVALEAGQGTVMIHYGNVLAALMGKIRLLTRDMLPPSAHQTTPRIFT